MEGGKNEEKCVHVCVCVWEKKIQLENQANLV